MGITIKQISDVCLLTNLLRIIHVWFTINIYLIDIHLVLTQNVNFKVI